MFTRISLITVIALPLTASAQVVFTEVMYDLETGGDSGREWVEIRNAGSASVDVSGYRFREGGTNHALVLSQGDAMLAPGGIAVITDTPSKFLADNPSFSGNLFDSSFSLSNAGETLVLKDSALVDTDSFAYSSDMGGAGDGKSLQRQGSEWIAALPTPGTFSASTPLPSAPVAPSSESSSSSASASSPEESSPSSASSAPGSSSKWPTKPQVYALAGEDRKVTAGTPAEFIGEALGIDKKPLENARYVWNFGDGAYGEGKHVLHSYRYPGSYLATLDVSSGEFSNSDKFVVTVIAVDLGIRSGSDSWGGYIELENRSGEEVDMSYWQILSGGRTFVLPKDTYLLGKKSVRFPESVTLLPYGSSAELRYPNGTLALQSSAAHSAPQAVALVPQAAPFVASPPAAAKASRESPTRIMVPQDPPVAAVAAATPLPTTTVASSHLGDYKWFYLLGALLASTLLSVIWLGRFAGGEVEIIEDPS